MILITDILYITYHIILSDGLTRTAPSGKVTNANKFLIHIECKVGEIVMVNWYKEWIKAEIVEVFNDRVCSNCFVLLYHYL